MLGEVNSDDNIEKCFTIAYEAFVEECHGLGYVQLVY